MVVGGYMYLNLNYTDHTNLTRTVQLMSTGFDLAASGMGQKNMLIKFNQT